MTDRADCCCKNKLCLICNPFPSYKKMITDYIYPPIPIRQFDWCAYYDGEEEGLRGFGETEQMAVADLKIISEE